MAKPKDDEFLKAFYPEMDAAGYTSVDGSIEFYGRISALLDEDMVVLDFGAGRGAWFADDRCAYRKRLRQIKGKVRKVIGCDVDPAVLGNGSLDESFIFDPGATLPLLDASVDVVVSDYVFEHVDDPEWFSRELSRILKPGGWICARTPSKWSYVAIAARAIPNRKHFAVLSRAQLERVGIDVFPTRYRLNTVKAISRYFPTADYRNSSYYFSAEPAYHFNSYVFFRILQLAAWLLPKPCHANLFVFLRKNDLATTRQV